MKSVKEHRQAIIVMVVIILIFAGLIALAYVQEPATTALFSTGPQVQGNTSDFLEIPLMTVPIFSEEGYNQGSLTVGMHLDVVQGNDIDPNHFIGSIDYTLRNFDMDAVSTPGSVERVQSTILNSLNNQTSFDVVGVYISDMFAIRN
ncbi:MAG: hypothetical protein FWG63_08140 [Defluviitaleaceae bacterium]|nr:hypothetical protein [Defluviitaleaceae bacterium]